MKIFQNKKAIDQIRDVIFDNSLDDKGKVDCITCILEMIKDL